MSFITHVDSLQAAAGCASKLESCGIRCTVHDPGNGIVDFGYSLWVPKEHRNEAHVILNSQLSADRFYDFFSDDAPLGE